MKNPRVGPSLLILFLLVVLVFLLAGCGSSESQKTNQCVRAELFQQCMKLLRAGPAILEQDKAVTACDSVAYQQSWRLESQISLACIAG